MAINSTVAYWTGSKWVDLTTVRSAKFSATLNEALDTSETAVDVSSVAEMRTGQNIKIDNETMTISAISTSANTITVIRGTATTLGAVIDETLDASEDSIDVTDTTEMFVNQVLQVDNEYLTVTAVNSINNITVTRGGGSGAATHSNQATILDRTTVAATHSSGAAIYYGSSDLIEMRLSHSLNRTQSAKIKLRNGSKNPLGINATQAAGLYNNTLGDFTPIKIFDTNSGQIYFYGVTLSYNEVHSPIYGMIAEIEAEDFLTEIKATPTKGATAFEVDTSVNLYDAIATTNGKISSTVARSTGGWFGAGPNVWDDKVAARGGLIKSLLTEHSLNNITHPGDANSGDSRFTESIAKFREDEILNVSKSQKTVLGLVEDIAKTDPHNAITNASEFGFDFYVDPNFTSTVSTTARPTSYFNYFKRGYRPNSTPSAYGLNLVMPNRHSIGSDGRFKTTGQQKAVSGTLGFRRPKNENYTAAAVSYTKVSSADKGAGAVTGDETTFEILVVDTFAANQANNFRWRGSDGYKISGGVQGTDSSENLSYYIGTITADVGTSATTITVADNTSVYVGAYLCWSPITTGSAEQMEVTAVNSNGTDITVERAKNGTLADDAKTTGDNIYLMDAAKLQFISYASSSALSGSETAYVLVSDIPSHIMNNTTVWGENANLIGEATGFTFQIKSRPHLDYGVRRVFNMSVGAETKDDAIRERVMAALLNRSVNTATRGSATVYNEPTIYFDNVPSAVSTPSGFSQTITFGNTELSGVIEYELNASDTDIIVSDTTGMYVGQQLLVDSEKMTISSIKNLTQLTVSRGAASTSAAEHDGSSTAKKIYDSNVNPVNYGFTIGMTVNELDASSKPTATFGYVSAVSSTQVTVVWNVGSASTSSTLRYYVPTRAGDICKVKDNAVGMDSNFLITSVNYTEGPGMSMTEYDLVKAASLQEGGSADLGILPQLADRITDQEEADFKEAMAKQGPIATDLEFTSASATQVNWSKDADGSTGGKLYFADETYNVEAGNTSANGDDSFEALSTSHNYIIYYKKGEDHLTTIRESNFAAIIAADYDDEIKIIGYANAVSSGRAQFDVHSAVKDSNGVGSPLKTSGTKILSDAGGLNVDSNAQFTGTKTMTGFTGTNGHLSVTNLGSIHHKAIELTAGGTVKFTGSSLSGTDVIVTSGNVLALKSSSAKYKENIKDLEYDREKLDGLSPKIYNYKKQEDDQKDIGLIAEDVNEILPELINYNSEGNPESVKYHGLSVMLLKEVQKLRQEIKELKEDS